MDLKSKLGLFFILSLGACSTAPERENLNTVQVKTVIVEKCPQPMFDLIVITPDGFFKTLPYRNIKDEDSYSDIVESYLISLEMLENRIELMHEQLKVYQYYNEEQNKVEK